MTKVSVIMPCLNVAQYIKQSVESVMQQTISDIEILVIDACSVDGTIEIIHELAKKDNRIKILYSDIKSYGYQVNIGISYASGDYIGIVDTDDYITKDAYEFLYNKAVETGADYVKGTALGFWNVNENVQYTFPIRPFKDYPDDILLNPSKSPFLLTCDNFLWYGLYKSDFIKKIKLHESPGAAFQDFGALFQIQTTAKKAIYTSHMVYYYRQDNVNASTYNHNGIYFIANEYGWAERFLDVLSDEWKKSFYKKQFLHLLDRIYAMAASKEYWHDCEDNMLTISNRIFKAFECGILSEQDFDENALYDCKLLLKSPHKLYEKYKHIYEESFRPLKNIVEIINKSNKQDIIIFGAGVVGNFIAAQLIYRKCGNIVCFCDNNKKVHSMRWNGIPVYSPENCVEKYKNAIYFIANARYCDEMKKQLVELGISDKNIIVYSGITNIHFFNERM